MAKKNKNTNNQYTALVLDVLKHNESKLLNYRQIATMLEITEESERLHVIEALEELRIRNLLTEKEPGQVSIQIA